MALPRLGSTIETHPRSDRGIVTGQLRNRPARPGSPRPIASARPDVLLRATNEFLRSDGLAEMGRAVMDAVTGMFGDAKAAVTFVGPDGSMALMSTVGYSPDEVEHLHDVVRGGSGLFRAVIAGTEMWSDDPDSSELRERITDWGGGSGLSIPIWTSVGVAGNLSLMFADEQRFDPSFRDAIRSLASQAGLAHELITARDELRWVAADAEAHRRVATAFYAVASRLAAVTDLAEVPAELVAAIRAATGATVALVALRDPGTEAFTIAAMEGASPEQAAIMAATSLTHEHFPILGGIGGGAAAPILQDGTVRGFVSITVARGDTFDAGNWQELAMGFASVAATAFARAEAVAEVSTQRAVLASAVAEQTVQLREAITELRSISDAKSDFLANVSHELRTPLTAILGYSEMLVGGDDGPLNQRQYDDATTILAHSRRLLELIDDLIGISHIEGNRIELDLRPTQLPSLVSGVVEELRALAGAKGIELTFHAGTGSLVLEADEVRLHEVFLNLVSNAVKFTRPGGTVRVEIEVEPEPSPWLDGPTVRIDVTDTGIGIPADEQERVFEKFHRIAGPEYAGTGLGLAIARAFVEHHGGTLTVESTVGLGSRFSVVLPLAQAAAAVPAA
jgi:signal transduction histidine kinase